MTFNSKDESYTDGKKVVLGANLDDKNFDVAVGLALHEGSHIKLSDFNVLRNLENSIPAQTFVLAEKVGVDRTTVISTVKNILNWEINTENNGKMTLNLDNWTYNTSTQKMRTREQCPFEIHPSS